MLFRRNETGISSGKGTHFSFLPDWRRGDAGAPSLPFALVEVLRGLGTFKSSSPIVGQEPTTGCCCCCFSAATSCAGTPAGFTSTGLAAAGFLAPAGIFHGLTTGAAILAGFAFSAFSALASVFLPSVSASLACSNPVAKHVQGTLEKEKMTNKWAACYLN